MLPRNHYFVNTKSHAGEDNANASALSGEANFAKTFCGKFEFDLGDVSHPSFETVNIKGEIPRFKARFERPLFEPEEVEEKAAGLTKWVEKYFDTTTDVAYFKDLVYTAWLFSVYVNPFHDIESVELELYIRCMFWYWYADDILELVVAQKVPTSKIENAMEQFLNVWNDELKPYEDIEDFPAFKPLYDSLVDIQQGCIRLSIKMEELSAFRNCMALYFGGIRWTSLETFNGNYSQDTFKYWRRINSFCDGFCLITLKLCGITLPDRIMTSPSVRRMLEILISVCAFSNDAFGIKKDLQNNEQDNIVLFKVFQKGIPMPQAVAEACELVKEELSDFMLLRDLCLREFPNDPDVVQFMDILESFLDGSNKFYVQSKRHLCAGRIKLT